MEAIKPLEARLDKKDRQRNIALITAVLCLIAAAFSVGYAVKSNEALSDQSNTNRIVVCANARQQALSFREPQISSSGEKETKNHFLNRLVGQRETLVVSGNLSCPDIKGFDTFEYLRGKALAEIDQILLRQAPHKARSLGIGVGEEGLGIDHPTPAGVPDSVTASPDESTQNPGSTASPEHQSTGGNTGTGGGTDTGGSGNGGDDGSKPKPVSKPEFTPGPAGPVGEAGAPGAGGAGGTGGDGGTGGEGDTTTPEEEAKPSTLLPGVTEPVEEVVCKSILGKLVCKPE